MAIATWLLVGLLTVQTVRGRDLRSRDLKDARQMLESELGDWEPSRLAREDARNLQSDLEDWEPERLAREDARNLQSDLEDWGPERLARAEDARNLQSDLEDWGPERLARAEDVRDLQSDLEDWGPERLARAENARNLQSDLEDWGPERLARDEVLSGRYDTRARDILQSELEDWEPYRAARNGRSFQSDLEDWEPARARRTASDEAGGTCGVPAIAPSVDSRVVGGVEALPHSWPWMVSLQHNGRHFCGGNLINNQWVLSAAHCGGRRGIQIEAVLGLHRQSRSDAYTVRVPVTDVILSKKYNNPSSPWATRGTSDIMLLKLEHPVEFNDAVAPICLPSLFQVLPGGKPCYSSGWGQLSTEGDAPDRLMQVMLPLIDRDVCNQPAWHNNTVDDSMVCAGYEEGELGNCYGDSGGPLVCYEEGHWLLYGIVSWGSLRGCAAQKGPTVYARASAYVRWIDRIISENSI